MIKKILFILVAVSIILGFILFKHTQTLENENPFGNVWQDKNSKGETYGDRATNMLRGAQSTLQELGIPMFPMYGTLLGIARHEGFIPWDDDIDICVPKDDFKRILNNTDRFAEHGIGVFLYGPLIKLYDINEPIIDGKNWSWPFIDIFGYVIKDDTFTVDDISLMTPTHSFKVDDVFPTITKYFEGVPMRTPGNYKTVLNGLYGKDWETECISSSWNHRKEKGYAKTHKKKCV